jgi:cysteine desulfurase
MHGGEQEFGIRAGTLAVHNIVGFGKAAELALAYQEKCTQRLQEIDKAARTLFASEPQFELLGDPVAHIPGLLSIVVRKETFDNERFIKKVSHQYAISAGSACTAGEPSHVLQAIERSNETSRVLRVSLSEMSSLDDVKQLIELLKNI